MEQILVDFAKIEVEYVQNIKETLKFIKRFKKLCNNGDPVAQIPEELSENSDILDQTFKDYQDILKVKIIENITHRRMHDGHQGST